MKVSIILPIYHQSDQVHLLLKIYEELHRSFDFIIEVIFVINGGDTKSYELLKLIENDFYKVAFLEQGGWGRAVIEGVNLAKGDWICYSNSARTHLEDWIKFFDQVKFDDSILYKSERQNRNWLRKSTSFLLNLEISLFLGEKVKDVNGTPKVFSLKAFEMLNITETGDFIDAELITKLIRNGKSVKPIKISNTNRLGGKSTTSLKTAVQFLLKIPFKIIKWKRETIQQHSETH